MGAEDFEHLALLLHIQLYSTLDFIKDRSPLRKLSQDSYGIHALSQITGTYPTFLRVEGEC